MPITHLMYLYSHMFCHLWASPFHQCDMYTTKKKGGKTYQVNWCMSRGCTNAQDWKRKKKNKNKQKNTLTNSYREAQEGGIYEDGIRGVE